MKDEIATPFALNPARRGTVQGFGLAMTTCGVKILNALVLIKVYSTLIATSTSF
jgi:hypothetical protein